MGTSEKIIVSCKPEIYMKVKKYAESMCCKTKIKKRENGNIYFYLFYNEYDASVLYSIGRISQFYETI